MFKNKLSTLIVLGHMVFMPLGAHASLLANPMPTNDISHMGFADLVAKVKPAVVSVKVRSTKNEETDFFSFFDFPGFDDMPDGSPIKRFFKDFNDNLNHENRKSKKGHLHLVAQGSGFFISKDGYIVTNDHLVNEGKIFTIVLDSGKEYPAKLIGRDPRTDIALLKIDSKDANFPYVAFGDDNKVRVGDWVVAVGNPFGLGGTVTAGIISARGRDIGASVYDDFLQIDAAVNRGNSGGPAFNTRGEVVGINTAIYSPSGGSVGIAFAIPSLTAQTVVQQLMTKGHVDRGWLGVETQEITKDIAESLGLADTNGILVANLTKDSAAEKIGLKSGDVIIGVNGQAIKNPRDFAKKIAAIAPKTQVELTILRKGKKLVFKPVLASMPNDADEDDANSSASSHNETASINTLGLNLAKNPKGAGLVVKSVDMDSDAAYKGFSAGLIIVSANNITLTKVEDFANIVKEAKKAGRKYVLLGVQTSSHEVNFIPLSLG